MGAELSIQDECLNNIIALPNNNYKGWNECFSTWNALTPISTEEIPDGINLPLCHDKRVWEAVSFLVRENLRTNVDDENRNRFLTELLSATVRLLCLKGLFKIFPSMGYSEMIAIINNYIDDHLDDSVLKHTLQAIKVSVERVSFKGAEKYDKFEVANKKLFYDVGGFGIIAELIDKLALEQDSNSDSKAELLSWALRIFDSTLSARRHTTDFETWKSSLSLLSKRLVHLFDFSRHSFPSVRKHACRLIKILILNSPISEVTIIQTEARDYGVLLWQLALSLEYRAEKQGKPDELVGLSRNLVSLFCFKNSFSRNVIQNALGSYLFNFLFNKNKSSTNGTVQFICDDFDLGIIINNKEEKRFVSNIMLTTWMSETEYILGNECWDLFFSAVDKDHTSAICIWNSNTRNEFRDALLNDISDLDYFRSVEGASSWDTDGFSPIFDSLSHEIIVDGYFLRLLIPELENNNPDYVIKEMGNPKNLLRSIFNKLVVEEDEARKFVYIYAIRCLLCKFSNIANDFEHLEFIFWTLKGKKTVHLWRDQLVLILCEVFRHSSNVKQVIKHNYLPVLLSFLMNIVREDLLAEQSITSPRTEVPLQSGYFVGEMLQITPLSNQQIVSLILHTLNGGITIVPRLRNALCSGDNLVCLIRVLMYPDMAIVISIVQLLSEVVCSTPKVFSKIHNTGIFAFLLATSDLERGLVLPAVEFLNRFHLDQDEKVDERGRVTSVAAGRRPTVAAVTKTKIKDRISSNSYLRHFLPLQVIDILIHNGTDAFCKILNCESVMKPDVIWTNGLRSHMVSCIENQMIEFRKAFLDNSDSHFEYFIPKVIKYDLYENILNIGGVFVDYFNAGEPFFNGSVDLTMFLTFLNEDLLDCLRKSKYDVFSDNEVFTRCAKVVKAINIILDNKDRPSLPLLFFDNVIPILKKDVNNSNKHELMALCLNIIIKGLKDGKGNVQLDKVLECITGGLLHVINSILEIKISDLVQASSLDFYSSCLKVLQLVTSIEGGRTKLIVEKKIIINNIILRCDTSSLIVNLSISKDLGMCLENLSLTPSQYYIDSGCLIKLLDVLCSDEILDENKSNDMIIILTSICIFIKNNISSGDVISRAFDQLLTPGLKSMLIKNQSKFLSILRTRENFESLYIVWNEKMRKCLKDTIKNQLVSIEKLKTWDSKLFLAADSYLYTFPMLDEIIIRNIYLRCFVADPSEILNDNASLEIIAVEVLNRLLKIDQNNVSEKYININIKALIITITKFSHISTKIDNKQIAVIWALSVNQKIKSETRMNVLNLLLLLSKNNSYLIYKPTDCFRLLVLCYSNLLSEDELVLLFNILVNLFSGENGSIAIKSGLILFIFFVVMNRKLYSENVRLLACKCVGIVTDTTREFGIKINNFALLLFFPLFSSSKTYNNLFNNLKTTQLEFYEKINSNEENFYLIWNEGVKESVLTYLQSEIQNLLKKTEKESVTVIPVLDTVTPFVNSNLVNEVVIQGIYIKYLIKHTELINSIDTISLIDGIISSLSDNKINSVNKEKSEKIIILWNCIYSILSTSSSTSSSSPVLFSNTDSKSYSLWCGVLKCCLAHLSTSLTLTIRTSALSVLNILIKLPLLLKIIINLDNDTNLCNYILDLLSLMHIYIKNSDGENMSICLEVFLTHFKFDGTKSEAAKFSLYFKNAGGILFLLKVIGENLTSKNGLNAAITLSLLCSNELVGPSARRFVCRLLTEDFDVKLNMNGDIIIAFWAKDHVSLVDGKKWEKKSRDDLVLLLNSALLSLDGMPRNWDGVTRRWVGDAVEVSSPREIKTDIKVEKKEIIKKESNEVIKDSPKITARVLAPPTTSTPPLPNKTVLNPPLSPPPLPPKVVVKETTPAPPSEGEI